MAALAGSTLINFVNPRLRRYTRSTLVAALVFVGLAAGTAFIFQNSLQSCTEDFSTRYAMWPTELRLVVCRTTHAISMSGYPRVCVPHVLHDHMQPDLVLSALLCRGQV